MTYTSTTLLNSLSQLKAAMVSVLILEGEHLLYRFGTSEEDITWGQVAFTDKTDLIAYQHACIMYVLCQTLAFASKLAISEHYSV